MLVGQSQSLVSCYKTWIAVLLIVTLAVFCALWSPVTPPGEWMRRFSPAQVVAVVDVVKNRSAMIFDVVLGSYSSSTKRSANTDLIVASPDERKANKTGRYVSMCQGNFDNRRIGNQLFNLAAMLHVAWLTGRRVAMVRRHPHGWLDRWFEVPVTRVDSINTELCPCAIAGEAGGLSYYRPMSALPNRTDITGKSLLICGWYQSWKYTVGVESALQYHLRLLPNVSAAVHDYLDQIQPSAWKWKSFRRIGIHVRAGDVLRRDKWSFGYTIPQRLYFEQAMSRFVSEQQRQQQGPPVRVQFVVSSDSLAWAKKAINFSSIAQQLNKSSAEVYVDVAYAEGHDAGFDLAVLSLCDGVIMSTGTYGWWGAWLANKTTIYYSNWPRAGSPLAGLFNRDDFFPPNWIPLDGPAFPCCQV